MDSRRRFGRYLLYDVLASGGMARVHLGRALGPKGFTHTVAIKRLHPLLAADPAFVGSLADEARLMTRISDARVVRILDVVDEPGDVLLVMEYVPGESLAQVQRAVVAQGARVPPPIACALVADALHGLHAAHVATTESGDLLGIVHRDVSPHNILVGEDGVARVLDFGIAKARGRAVETADGQVKGRLAYMAPEQLLSGEVTARSDVYSSGVVLWELLTGRRMFESQEEGHVIGRVLQGGHPPPSASGVELPPGLDALVSRALSLDASLRYSAARDMAAELEDTQEIASHRRVAEWLSGVVGDRLAARRELVRRMETEEEVEEAAAAAAPLPVSTEAGEATSLTLSDIVRPPVVTTVAAPRRLARTAWYAVGFSALALGVGGAAAALSGATDAKDAAAESVAGSQLPLARSSTAASALVPAVSATSSAVALAPSSPASVAPAAASQAPTAGANKVGFSSGRPATSDPCAVRFTVDERGIRHPKKECIGK